MRSRWLGLGSMLGMTLLGACLADRGQVDRGDTSGGETDSTTTTSTTATTSDTSIDPDTRECEEDCNDNNPCTVDQCVDGECVNDPVTVPTDAAGAALPTCESNDDCSWGGACEIGTCVFEDGCGGTVGYCSFETDPECGGCENGCDDGNACTEDFCFEDACQHIGDADCDPDCTTENLMSVSESLGWGPGAEMKVLGGIEPFRGQLLCNDGPTCDCVGKPALVEEAQQLAIEGGLTGVGGAAQPEWVCETTGCGEATPSCEPLPEGVVFRAWGVGAYRGYLIPFGADAFPGEVPDPVPPPVDTLVVQDYCLDTARESLVGTYTGRLHTMGQVIDFKATMSTVDQGVLLELKGPTCAAACPEWVMQAFPQTVVLEEGDGRIGFDFEAPWPSGNVPARAKLYSKRATLQGRWLLPDVQGDAVEIGGRVVLTRMGTGAFIHTDPSR